MGNMSYCRFENTVGDLEDCAEHITDTDLSATEAAARRRLVEVAANMLEELGVDFTGSIAGEQLQHALEDLE